MAKDNIQPNSYLYHRQWFNFQHENMDRISANHIALYLYVVEINNRLAWVKCFGITVRECMDGMRCKSRNTYLNTFHDLIDWGFFKLVKPSRNQFQCNVISLPIFKQNKLTFFDQSIIKNQNIYRNSLIKNSTSIDTGNSTSIDTGNSTSIDTGNSTSIDTGNSTILQTSLQIDKFTNLQLVVEYIDAINFFCGSSLKRTLEEKFKILPVDMEKIFEDFFSIKSSLGELNNKPVSEITRHFYNWLPGELTRDNNFKKNNQNGTEQKSRLQAIADAGLRARKIALRNAGQ